MRQILPILLLGLALITIPGCTSVPPRSRAPERAGSTESAEALFLKSFGELAQSDRSPALESLRKFYPESNWTKKADVLAGLYRSYRQAMRRTRNLQGSLRSCETEQRQQKQRIDQLKNDLQRMKDLVIEMELRSK